ncbi:MAG: hypothetical protein ACOCPR_02140 [Guyparkeria sp.]|uniref:hypothetical protein n=1 Tax=Guyparkeria sp. TaxID=2035736 RepID=UPI00397D393A
MSQREYMQRLVELKRALEKEMGITIDMERYGVEARLRRLAQACDDPAVRELVARLDQPAPDTDGASPRIRGYYRGRPIYEK